MESVKEEFDSPGLSFGSGASPLGQKSAYRQVIPFAVVALGGFVSVFFGVGIDRPSFALIAFALTGVIIASSLLLPWQRIPQAWHAAPALSYFGVIVLLRHAAGGSDSGFAPLVFVPILWLSLYGRRHEMLAAVGATVLVFTVPQFLGAAGYSGTEWRRAFLFVLVGLTAGHVIQSLLARIRSQSAKLQRSSRAIARLMEATRAVTGGEDPRGAICEAALEVSGAHVVALVEPEEDFFIITSHAGAEIPRVKIDRSGEPSGSGVAFVSRQRYFVPDAVQSPAVSARLVEATGVRSVLFEPVVGSEGDAIGVLVVGWDEPIAVIEQDVVDSVAILVADAAIAIERSDMVERLEEMARTDPLTGLANRRVLDEEVERELIRAARTGHPVCVALIDLDNFKVYNDTYGHQAGDVALKEAASGWSAMLRKTDLLGRYGGEEFVALLPHGEIAEACEVLSRLQQVQPGGLTFSAGVARWDGSESAGALVGRADAALYEAKAAGKDRLHQAASPAVHQS